MTHSYVIPEIPFPYLRQRLIPEAQSVSTAGVTPTRDKNNLKDMLLLNPYRG